MQVELTLLTVLKYAKTSVCIFFLKVYMLSTAFWLNVMRQEADYILSVRMLQDFIQVL